ncbi:MAG TPA: LacI family DNA-binding transcriptional regulator [Ilumatobacteraceae bacterium]|jgi:DNA-binding LacI/PurR family transcriptional regulator|nr:LacI family DNA-binding transcriptional regulator [Ilumatobacteraceae bacterium]
MSRVTLQTIADRVGVSRMTVSNAFSRPDQLSADLRGRILTAAEELGYAGPDPAARALARGTAGAVGVLLTDSLSMAFTDEVATTFLGAVAEELAPTGLALTLLSASDQPNMIPARDVPMDGALVYSCNTQSTAVEWLKRRKLPLVYVDQAAVPGIASINIDDRAGARAAAQHLVDLGHRRIDIVTQNRDALPGMVTDPIGASTVHVQKQRMLGWFDALDAAGIRPRVAQERPLDQDGGGQAALLLLDSDDPPTAVLCFSDVIAYGIVQAAQARGLRVPEDLSVVGFDDNPLAERMRPALTTVRQDVAAKGHAAAAALTAAIERSRTGTNSRVRHVLLPTQLIVRDSTTKPA